MASNDFKDMRRPELSVPFKEQASKAEAGDFQSTIASTLPMAAIFTRNRYIGWASFIFSMQSWLGESASAKNSSTSSGLYLVAMAGLALAVTYLPLFLPPALNEAGTAPATAPQPVPLA